MTVSTFEVIAEVWSDAFAHCIATALNLGIPHFDLRGNKLVTTTQVLQAIIRDGKVDVREIADAAHS